MTELFLEIYSNLYLGFCRVLKTCKTKGYGLWAHNSLKSSFLVNYRPTNHSLQSYVFFKTLENSRDNVYCGVSTQSLHGSFQNSCAAYLFGKLPGRPVNVLKNDRIMDVLLRSFQKFSVQLFFRNTNGQVLLKPQTAFFPRATMGACGWMNMQYLRSRYL